MIKVEYCFQSGKKRGIGREFLKRSIESWKRIRVGAQSWIERFVWEDDDYLYRVAMRVTSKNWNLQVKITIRVRGD